MPWQKLGEVELTREWTLTIPVDSEIFRVKHLPISNPKKQYLKAVIAPSFIDEGVNLYEPKRLSYRDESEIFTFYFPASITQHSIGLRRLDESGIEWKVEIEAFISTKPEEDFSTYLLARFKDLVPLLNESNIMALYQRGTAVTPLSVASDRINLAAEETKKVLDTNSRRRNLTITNGSSTLLIFGRLDGQNPADVIITLLPNEVYEFPNLANGSIYMGDIFVRNLTRSAASAGYTEFNAPQ